MNPARTQLVELARSFHGVGMSTDPDRYLGLVAGPFDGEPRARAALGQMSGCGLVVRGLWRAVGIAHGIFEEPYRIGRAMMDIVEIAAEADAIRPSWYADSLLAGDAIFVGGPGAGGPEHVWTVLDNTALGYPDSDTMVLPGLDGGQRDEHGRECIRVVLHEIAGNPPSDDGRRVRWIIDFDAVWRRFGRKAA